MCSIGIIFNFLFIPNFGNFLVNSDFKGEVNKLFVISGNSLISFFSLSIIIIIIYNN